MSINMKFEVLLLFFCMIIISGCSTKEFNESCSSDIGNFGHDVVLTKYYAFDSYFFDGIYKKNTTLTFSAMSKVILDLRKDSIFSKIVVDSLNDTLEIQNGHFSIHKMPSNDWVKENEVYSFVFTVDSTMKRWKKNEKNEIEKTISISTMYGAEVNDDSLLLDVAVKDTCFVLASLQMDDFYCTEKHYFSSSRKFCANLSMRDSSIVGIVEE